MTDDAILGTDATENWNKTEFQALLSLFDKGKHGILPFWNVTFILTRLGKWLGLMNC
jgi:hypothetical protein